MVWGTGLTSCDRAGWRIRFPALLGHATLPITGASVTACHNLYETLSRRFIEINRLWSEIGNVADPTENANNCYYIQPGDMTACRRYAPFSSNVPRIGALLVCFFFTRRFPASNVKPMEYVITCQRMSVDHRGPYYNTIHFP